MKPVFAIPVIAASAVFFQPVFAADADKDMATLFKNSKKFAYLSDSIEHIGKTKLLKGPGPFTFFVPENKAFDDLEYGRWVVIWHNKTLLNKVLMRGLVKGKFDKTSFQDGKVLRTINGGTLKITKQDGQLWIGKSKIKDTDIQCKNGIVHVVSKFLGKETDSRSK